MKKNTHVIPLQLGDLLEQIKFPQRNREYVVLDLTSPIIKSCQYYRADYFSLILIEEGTAYYNIGDYEYELHKGDIVFSVPQEVFKIIYYSADIREKQLFFSVDMIADAGFNYRSNDVLKSLSDNPSYIIHNEPALYDRLVFYMKGLSHFNDFNNPVYFSNEMIWHLFSLLMYEIDDYTRNQRLQTNTSSREEQITTAFFTLVKEFYIAHHDVQFYADQLFVSRKYLSKVVKKTMTRTPKEIINQVLLIEAKVLLKNSANNVSQVANLLNFSDQAVFSKFFKNQTGKKPSEYKIDELF